MNDDFPQQAELTQSIGYRRRDLLTHAGLASIAIAASGCAGLRGRAPYAGSEAPDPSTLIAALKPRFKSVRITQARAHQALLPSVAFAALAQGPKRIHASLTLKGQELLTLVSNEFNYGLRYSFSRGIPQGYYSGKPSRCALEAFLGVDMEIHDLISILLGGGPNSMRFDAVLDQGWQRRTKSERIVFFDQNKRRAQVCNYIYDQGTWLFRGAVGYHYRGNDPQWMWSVEHLEFQTLKTGGRYPKIIQLGAKDGNRRSYTRLELERVELDVEIAAAPTAKQLEAKDFEDDEGWESADGDEWEDGDNPPTIAAPRVDTKKSPLDSIPPVFIPNPSGLVARGDLCRDQRLK